MHEDFVDGEGNPEELHGVKKYWRVETVGDQDYFFDVTPTSEETPLPLLPDAIETELHGGNDGVQNKFLVALSDVVNIDNIELQVLFFCYVESELTVPLPIDMIAPV